MATLGVNTIIYEHDRILLIRRIDIPVWALPGGGVDASESLIEAAVRETMEETGLTIEIERLSGIYSRPKWRAGGDHVAAFVCRPVGGELRRTSRETVDCRYYHPEALPSDLWPPHRQMVHDAMSSNGHRTHVRTSDDEWPFEDDAPWSDLVKAFRESDLSAEQFMQAQGWC